MSVIEHPMVGAYRLYVSLLEEVPGSDLVWKHNGRTYSAADMLNELLQSSEVAGQYARAIMHLALESFFRPTKLKIPDAAELDTSVPAATIFTEQFKRLPPDTIVWHTMSWTFTAGEMPGRIEAQDDDALVLMSDVMRITRDRFRRELRKRIQEQ